MQMPCRRPRSVTKKNQWDATSGRGAAGTVTGRDAGSGVAVAAPVGARPLQAVIPRVCLVLHLTTSCRHKRVHMGRDHQTRCLQKEAAGVHANTSQHADVPLDCMRGKSSRVTAGEFGASSTAHRLDDARSAPEAPLELHLELFLVLLQLVPCTRATREAP